MAGRATDLEAIFERLASRPPLSRGQNEGNIL
jgi:hypothetical protein